MLINYGPILANPLTLDLRDNPSWYLSIEESSLQHFLTVIVDYVTFGIDIATAIIIGASVIIALVGYMKTLARRQPRDREAVRFRLAGGLLLALDFEVGSDILKTIIVPTVTELVILSVIVALRIVLGWSLSKEISGHSEDLLTK